jgi:peptidoglycan/xylan/chitin deacetylase (PgdA/CDA1 family)
MWPKGTQCAVSLTFDLDAESVWLSENPANADKPGVLSQGRYGPRVAVPLILSMLERHGFKATFFVPGKVAEDYPETLKTIANAGHELGVHGYTHVSPTKLSATEEEESIVRSREILEGFGGGKVVGYRSPSWEFSQHTLGFLTKHGFTYSSNYMDDIHPYLHPGTDVVELPIHWSLDDAPHFWFDEDTWNKKISTPSEVREIWDAEFEAIHKMRASFVLTMHPQIIGRPSRIKMLEEFVGFVKQHQGVWFATCSEVAEEARKSLK